MERIGVGIEEEDEEDKEGNDKDEVVELLVVVA